MADLKISALTASTTPLAGTEVLPIVQSGTTKQVSVANLTAGRAVSAQTLALNAAGPTLLTITGTTASGYASLNLINNATRTYAVGVGGSTESSLGLANTFYIYDGTAPGVRLTIAPSGDVAVKTGNLVIGTSGKGIDFSATPGTGTSELLADYEEGTFTATLTTTTGSVTLAAATDLCSYTKVGRQVTVTGLIIVSSVSSPTGSVSLNLPFAIGNDGESSLGGGSFVIYQDAPTYATTLQTATFEEGTSVLSIGLSAALIGAADQFRFSFTYFA